MAKDFSITSEQRHYLWLALQEPLYTGPGSGYRLRGAVCNGMVKRGWLREKYVYGYQGTHYEITELGRTVARQLGIEP